MMLHSLLTRFVFFLVLTRVKPSILRLPCAKYADFCIIEGDKRMEGHVLMEIRNTDDAQCTVECVQQPQCRSYNLERNERICQLNSKALADDGTILVSKPGWIYKSTDYNRILLGIACEQLNPCPRGILCKDKCDAPYFECIHCDKYHYGLHCDRRRDLDECASNPCKNGAVCVDKVADYSCTCPAGYTGKNCEQNINECGSFPCLNGGTCRDEVNKFSCTCAPGFSGSKCETNINECQSKPCGIGGDCVDLVNKYQCSCHNGFYGPLCKCAAIFSASNGSIMSPFYPQKYPNLFKCSYTINAPQGKFIKIDFDFFEVEDADDCGYDFLTITESSSNVHKRYCGTFKPLPCVSRSNSLQMTFTTDQGLNKKGFNMSYVFVDSFGSLRSCAGS